jgi:zinc transport system ATP-binding protein
VSIPQDPPLLSLHDVSVTRRENHIIHRIDLTIHRGEIVTVIGPNGAGKSTLIKTALGLIRPDEGEVIRHGSPIIGYVPQSVSLDPALPLSVRRFLALSGISGEKAWRGVLDKVGAMEVLDASMHDISGGEMRRVLLARALLRGPELLILDEPTAGVDVSGQGALYRLIQGIREEFQCAVLLVSHDLHVVMAATDRVFCLNRHICCSGAPDQIRGHPEYLAIFGRQDSAGIGIYRHHHDHHHNLHGEVCSHDAVMNDSEHG